MGGEDKDKDSMKSSARQTKEKGASVFDIAISRLLQDFTSAELFPQSSDFASNVGTSDPDSNFDGVVVSMKQLHLRKPARTRLKRNRKHTARRKPSSDNLNLAVAAGNFQKPIVWPARLSSNCKKSAFHLVHPSRLQVDSTIGKGLPRTVMENKEKQSVTCTSAKQNSPKENKSVTQEVAPFGSTSSVDYSSLSFSGLCGQASPGNAKSDTKGSSSGSDVLDKQVTTCSSTTLSKRHITGCVRPAKFARTVEGSDDSVPYRTVFAGYRCRLSSESDLESDADAYHHISRPVTNSQAVPHHLTQTTLASSSTASRQFEATSSLESLATLRSALTSSAPSTSQIPSDNLSRSCSQEVRMEETNVNELASYFDDLLHIPRKMSTMAEMMYA